MSLEAEWLPLRGSLNKPRSQSWLLAQNFAWQKLEFADAYLFAGRIFNDYTTLLGTPFS